MTAGSRSAPRGSDAHHSIGSTGGGPGTRGCAEPGAAGPSAGASGGGGGGAGAAGGGGGGVPSRSPSARAGAEVARQRERDCPYRRWRWKCRHPCGFRRGPVGGVGGLGRYEARDNRAMVLTIAPVDATVLQALNVVTAR